MQNDLIFLLKDEKITEILDILNNVLNDNKVNISTDVISCRKIKKYATILYFKDFFVMKYFDKIFLFNNSKESIELSKLIPEELNINKFIGNNSIGLILDRKKVSDVDFINLKKCYMLTKNIKFTKDNKIYCKYNPYYLICLELNGKILTIAMPTINSFCELNMDNVTTDLKTFLKEIFSGIDESQLKIHHEILKYYSTLDIRY